MVCADTVAVGSPYSKTADWYKTNRNDGRLRLRLGPQIIKILVGGNRLVTALSLHLFVINQRH